MLLTLVKFNDGGKIYLENIDGDTFGFRFTHKISMGLHLGYKISLKNFVMFMWVRPKGISLIPGRGAVEEQSADVCGHGVCM